MEEPDLKPTVDQKNISTGHKKGSRLLIFFTALVVIGVAIGGYAWINNPSSPADKSTTTQPFFYQYSINLLDNANVSSGTTKISFKKPVQMFQNKSGPYDKTEFKNLSVTDFSHAQAFKVGGYYYGIIVSSLSAGFTPTGNPLTDTELTALKNVLDNPSDDVEYQDKIKPLKDFAMTGVTSKYAFTMGRAQAFTNSHIQDNAWQFDVNLTDEKAKMSGAYTKVSSIQGKLIYAVTKNTTYYLVLESLDYDWQANQKIWQSVLDSIKIDQ